MIKQFSWVMGHCTDSPGCPYGPHFHEWTATVTVEGLPGPADWMALYRAEQEVLGVWGNATLIQHGTADYEQFKEWPRTCALLVSADTEGLAGLLKEHFARYLRCYGPPTARVVTVTVGRSATLAPRTLGQVTGTVASARARSVAGDPPACPFGQ